MLSLAFPLNHAAWKQWAHLGSNQGDRPDACSGVGRQTARFAGEIAQAHPGNRTHTWARSGRADGHQMDTAVAA